MTSISPSENSLDKYSVMNAYIVDNKTYINVDWKTILLYSIKNFVEKVSVDI